MAVLVDTNVIADVLHGDPNWGDWATQQLAQHAGELFINPIIFAELCYRATAIEEVNNVLETLGLRFTELPRSALFLAAHAYSAYRQRGGNKTAPLPDFFIGAHAQSAGCKLLTRDKSRYATYFPQVALICP
jgi:predicted nucleic acid-binding protein